MGGRGSFHVVAVAVLFGGLAVGIVSGGEVLLVAVRSLTARLDVRSVQAMVLTYHARYGALPGDDRRAPARWGRRRPVLTLSETGRMVDLAGNGRWDGRLMEPGHEMAEGFAAWADLSAAGLWAPAEEQVGRVGLGRVPRNRFGGVMVFASGVLGLRNAVCLTEVPADRAVALDAAEDDGNPATGAVRAAVPESGWTMPLFNESLRSKGVSSDPDATVLLCAVVGVG